MEPAGGRSPFGSAREPENRQGSDAKFGRDDIIDDRVSSVVHVGQETDDVEDVEVMFKRQLDVVLGETKDHPESKYPERNNAHKEHDDHRG